MWFELDTNKSDSEEKYFYSDEYILYFRCYNYHL
jgi:hypothetical protein